MQRMSICLMVRECGQSGTTRTLHLPSTGAPEACGAWSREFLGGIELPSSGCACLTFPTYWEVTLGFSNWEGWHSLGLTGLILLGVPRVCKTGPHRPLENMSHLLMLQDNGQQWVTCFTQWSTSWHSWST